MKKSHIIGGALGAHLAVTVLAQLPNDSYSRLKSRDLFAAVPTWRFFAPIPARADYHLYCRGVSSSAGTQSEWVDIHPVGRRRLSHMLWHPDHRAEKGVFDVMAQLLRAFPYSDGESIHDSTAYRVMEGYVVRNASKSPELESYSSFQFAIVSSAGHDTESTPRVVFVSREISNGSESLPLSELAS